MGKTIKKKQPEQSRLGFDVTEAGILRPPEVPIERHAADAPQNRIGDTGTTEYVRIGDYESAISAKLYARFENAMDAMGGIPRLTLPKLIEAMLEVYENRNH